MTNGSGFSPARLARMHDVIAGYVERGDVPGVVTLVSRRGDIHVDTHGTLSVGGSLPMRRDTIFRIASMTKPMLAAATLILAEECRLRLDDPIDPWLPELAGRRVLRSIDSSLTDTVPAQRSISVLDLLTLRPGIGAIIAPPDTYPIQRALAEAGLDPGADTPQVAPDEWLRRLGDLPLVHQPGEVWMYHTGFDILAILLARVTGQPLEEFLRERIFAPLGMHTTGFSLPQATPDRLAAVYIGDPETGALVEHQEPDGAWVQPPPFASEVLSTADDVAAFGAMLLNGGRHERERILSRPSVELMTTDQITPVQKAVSPFFPGFWDNTGWGLGVSLVTRRDGISASPGRYGWSGGWGTSWGADPREELQAVLLFQRLFDGPSINLLTDFWTLVYQAIDD